MPIGYAIGWTQRSTTGIFTGYLRFEPKPEQPQAGIGLRDEDDDEDDEEEDDFEKDDDGDGDGDGEEEEEETLLSDFGGERKALTFKEVEDATRSYSSMRFARSSSEVIETNASRSSVGNWQRRLTAEPHNSPIFNNSSVKHKIPTNLTQFVSRTYQSHSLKI